MRDCSLCGGLSGELAAGDLWRVVLNLNQDRHVHLHAIPRYQTPRSIAGITFPVLDSLDGGVYYPPAPIFDQIAATVRGHLA